VVAALSTAIAAPAMGQSNNLERFWLDAFGPPLADSSTDPYATMSRSLLAKARPDECFNGIGGEYLPLPPGAACEAGVPKVNEGYVYGLTKAGNQLWIGTVANMQCMVLGELSRQLEGYLGTGLLDSALTSSYGCELGHSDFLNTQLAIDLGLPPELGDWRPPHIYRYDTKTRALVDMIPGNELLMATHGIRSAATLGDMVIMAGPSIYSSIGAPAGGMGSGVNFFVFHRDGTFVEACEARPDNAALPYNYNDIRRWTVAGGVLYAAVATADHEGRVIRWTGDLTDPCHWTEVGELPAEGAEIAFHEGRLFVLTWPNLLSPTNTGGTTLYMSPVLPSGGLVRDPGTDLPPAWTAVWKASDYERDPLLATTYMGGAMHSYGGYLHWGTIHLPFMGMMTHLIVYGIPTDAEDLLGVIAGTHRPTHLFRGRNFGTAYETKDLLYGLPYMPAYNPMSGQWALLPSGMGAPLFGLPGYGNFFNTYTWSMAAYSDQLFIGTMDWSYLLGDALPMVLDVLGVSLLQLPLMPLPTYGADLFRMPSVQSAAVPETISGLGNYLNYGLRNLIADDGLYVGTANPMNLCTDPTDLVPEGGWELWVLRKGKGSGKDKGSGKPDKPKK
jgi:hypothetical protein